MLSGEFASRAKKLQREQKERAEAALRKAERERAVEERLRRQREKHEEEVRQRRMAEQAAAEAERLKHEEAVEANNGVWWKDRLRVVPIDEAAAVQKGIKRGADKVLLPPSVGAELMRQDAPKNGAQLFEITSSSGASTHAGVLDFTSVEGTVGMPPAVSRNLFGESMWPPTESTYVTVTYCKLPKGVYARFQPRTADFQKDVGDDVRVTLEAALERHSTLTEGNWISVPFAGSSFELLVQKLRPGKAVSVIDTELEAEVEPSMETEERLKAEEAAREEAERRRQEELTRLAQEAIEQAAAAEERRKAEEEAAAQQAADLERTRQAKAAALPPEPSLDQVGTTLCLIRLPNGGRCSRRFRTTDPGSLLFDFVDAQSGAGIRPGSYRLVAQYPRRVISLQELSTSATLADAGLTSRQEALLLEPLREQE